MNVIPKIVHRLWLSPPGPPLPTAFRQFHEHTSELMPDWDTRLYTSYSQLPDLHPSTLHLIDRARHIYPFDAHRFVADLVRLELLWNEGGVWLDTDVQVREPLDGLVADRWFVAARSPQQVRGKLCLGGIG